MDWGKHDNANWFHFKFVSLHLLRVLRMSFRSFHSSLASSLLGISSKTLSLLILFPQPFDLPSSSSPCWWFQFSFQCGNRNYKRISPITKVTNIPVIVILQCFSSVIVNEFSCLSWKPNLSLASWILSSLKYSKGSVPAILLLSLSCFYHFILLSKSGHAPSSLMDPQFSQCQT